MCVSVCVCVYHPGLSCLLSRGLVTPRHADAFRDVTGEFLELITELFDDVERIRVHGDCHGGNLLYRPGEGVMVIDFDDRMMAPPVQDLWLLLPDRADRCQRELATRWALRTVQRRWMCRPNN